jgi:TonB family protein
LAKPEELYKEATPVALSAYGAESPDYARFLNEVGRYYHTRRKYEIAERLYMQAFGIRVRAFGQEHPEVAESICNLAVLFENQARYPKAEVYYRTALGIREKLLGPEDVATLETREHFARLLTKMSKTAEAAEQIKLAAAARTPRLEQLTGERVDIGEVVRGGLGVEAPLIDTRVEPGYTDEARIGRHEGAVELEVEIDADGHPRNLRVVRSLGLGLDEKAIEAVRLWRFKPARRDNKKVAFRALLEIEFRLL